MPPAEQLRYEMKMVAPVSEWAQVRAMLNVHPAGFHAAYPRRRVNNIYFDTINLDSYAENLSGIAQRMKLRLRWYGKEIVIRRGILELKCKLAGPGWKLSHAIGVTIDLGRKRWPAIVAAIRRDAPPRFVSALDVAHRPIVINHYERDYLISNDGRVRITVDGPQSVYSQLATSVPNLRIDCSRHGCIVVEAKVDTEHRDRLIDVLSDLPLHVGRHSKYVTAVAGSLF